MAFKLNKGNINFGKGTKGYGSPNKIKNLLSPKWIAFEGYNKAWKAHKEKKRKEEEAKKTSEMMERINSNDHVAHIDATHNMVQVWDEKLGRNKWVYNPEAYNEKQKETKKSTTSKIPAVGTEARKEYYDANKLKYDDTIKGYNRDGTKKKEEVKSEEQKNEPKENVKVKNTSDPFAGSGDEEKFDKKKLKDTKAGKFLGVGQGSKRRSKRNKRRNRKHSAFLPKNL